MKKETLSELLRRLALEYYKNNQDKIQDYYFKSLTQP